MSKSAVKFIALIKKKEGLSQEAFKEYYETKHVPLVASIYNKWSRYIRNYTGDGVFLHPDLGNQISYDAITEFWFDTEDDYEGFMEALKTEREGADRVGIDELNFIKKDSVQIFRVQECGGEQLS